MKKPLLFCFLFITAFTFGQKVTVKGIAIDSTNGFHRVNITINDTVNKYFENSELDIDKIKQLYLNKNYSVRANKKGKFKIRAKLTDSLYFRYNRQITQAHLVSDLILRDNIRIVLNPEICEKYIPCKDKKPKLYVFIGKKIKVDYGKRKYYCNKIPMESKFEANYEIIENLFGDYKKDTIKFVAYDHYGRPEFSKFENVILYVAEYCGELIHVKYQYNNVYKTKNEKWASPYQGFDYNKLDSLNIKKPILMDFKDEVKFIFGKDTDTLWFKRRFPESYYEINGFKAKALYGNYAIDIFEIMKKTILKSRGFFE